MFLGLSNIEISNKNLCASLDNEIDFHSKSNFLEPPKMRVECPMLVWSMFSDIKDMFSNIIDNDSLYTFT
jgi:hypothetical protein